MSADSIRLVEDPAEEAVWHLYDADRMRGTISQLPTGEFYCTAGLPEFGCYLDLDEAEEALRNYVICQDYEAELTEPDEWEYAAPDWENEEDPRTFGEKLTLLLIIVGSVCISLIMVGFTVRVIAAIVGRWF